MSYISAILKQEKVLVWERDERGERIVQEYSPPLYFYESDPNGKYETIYGQRVTKHVFSRSYEFHTAKKQAREQNREIFESDISPEIRILSNFYYGKPAPKLNITLYDIEVDYDPNVGFAGYSNPYAPINSVALVHHHSKRLVVFCVPPTDGWTEQRLIDDVNAIERIPDQYTLTVKLCKNERELLVLFLNEIEDSDVICGWNSSFFDLPYIGQRVIRVLGQEYLSLLDFDGATPTFREVRNRDQTKVLGTTLDLHGRLGADYMVLYKKFEPGERSSYKLASIEQVVGLKLPKLEYEGSLHDLYRDNFAFFVRYNIRDTEILDGFENKLGYIQLANELYHLSGGQFKEVSGTLKLAEHAIVNYCHHTLKKVVNDSKMPTIDRQIAGAFVLDPKIGMHELSGSIDINSLYPSAIRSINISPETLRGQFVECSRAAEAIARRSVEDLTLVVEGTEENITMQADQWRNWLTERQWAVSGYGTCFDQSTSGIIPSILAEWYDTRKRYQKMKQQAGAKAADILKKYKSTPIEKDPVDSEREELRNADNTGMDGLSHF